MLVRWFSERHAERAYYYIGSFVLGFAFALPNLRLAGIRRGEVSSPNGLGDPTPTGSGCEVSAVFNPCNLRNPHKPRFRQVFSHASRITFHVLRFTGALLKIRF